jgi:hypothetical protein
MRLTPGNRIVASTSFLLFYTTVLFQAPLLEVAHFFSHLISGHAVHFDMHSISDHGAGHHSHEVLQLWFDDTSAGQDDLQPINDLTNQSLIQIFIHPEMVGPPNSECVQVMPNWIEFQSIGVSWNDYIPPNKWM